MIKCVINQAKLMLIGLLNQCQESFLEGGRSGGVIKSRHGNSQKILGTSEVFCLAEFPGLG